MKKIALNNKKFTSVDDEDFEYLNQWNWQADYSRDMDNFYVTRKPTIGGKRVTIRMHRLVMNCPEGMVVDHINGDTLNNQKSNLRICTIAENSRNRVVNITSQSGYKGVVRSGKSSWWSRIKHKKVEYYLGMFPSPELAAKAYDVKALELFGEFAKLNFPKSNG